MRYRFITATAPACSKLAKISIRSAIRKPKSGKMNRAAFFIQWNCPGLDLVSEQTKSKWIMTQWTDELAAGCEKLIYFGGEGEPIGNGEYMLSDHTPLPVAATLAVFAAKTFHAAPVGVFSSAANAQRYHLFDRDGKSLLVVESNASGKGTTALAVGAASVRITDCQGNETELATADGVVHLPNTPLPYFVEGANLDVLKANLVPTVVAPGAGAIDLSRATPQVTLLQGKPGSIQVRLRNLFDHALSGTLRTDLPATWTGQPQTSFDLQRGQQKILSIPVTVPETTALESFSHAIVVSFSGAEELPSVTKSVIISVISPESVGNLLQNGDFSQLEANGKTPKHWSGSGAELISSEGLGLGLGKRVLKFTPSDQWANFGQTIPLRGGTTYLYTAWVWNRGKEGGSNIVQTMKDGSSRSLYDNSVINIGDHTAAWQVFTCRYQAPKDIATAAFVPVVRGPGSALYDNLRVSVFEGSDFAAEAMKVRTPPKIDGQLDDWDGKCPIPLIGRNQLQTLRKDYAWTPQNISGVAYLRWDAKNLYVAVDVLDDIHHPAGDGDFGHRRRQRRAWPSIRPIARRKPERNQCCITFPPNNQRAAAASIPYGAASSTAVGDPRAIWLVIRRSTN